MIQRQLIGTARVPGGEELRLVRHGGDYMIVLAGNELMSTRMSGSEEALAALACDRLGGRAAAHVLVGGYGMGFTLRALLGRLPQEARVTVAELVPEILEWARGPMADWTAGCLDDRRVELLERDVAEVIAEPLARYDAILLDVDNGPDGLVREANDRLYTMAGLQRAKQALRPEGVLAVWSAARDTRFTARLRQAGFAVEEVAVSARANGKGPRHVIWLAGNRIGHNRLSKRPVSP